ncbi:MAG: hypothetical protein HQ455_10385 [Burkholderiales bacterium]|jgi:hypothetical protein|nr:hypothetical protein [Burkholderiales bacterium]
MNLALITTHQLFQRIDAAYKAFWPANDPHMTVQDLPTAPTKPLRVVRIAEDGANSPYNAGRMVMSGRMADICAELDRLVHLEASKSQR